MSTYDPITGRHDICSVDISVCYARSVYFVLSTMTTVGYGDIAPYTDAEFICEHLVVVIGICAQAALCGASTAVILDWNSTSEKELKIHIQEVNKFAKFRNLSGELTESIIAHFRNIWARERCLSKKVLVTRDLSLPASIEVAMLLKTSVFEGFSILSEAVPSVQRRIAHAMMPQIALPNTNIYSEGYIGQNIYFLLSGLVYVRLPDESVVKVKETKDVMDSILFLMRRKEAHFGPKYSSGFHFGEFCMVEQGSARVEDVDAIEKSGMLILQL